jgi:hypothetical protein
MPHTCFSYPADVPPGITNLAAVQHSGWLACFSYPGAVPPDIGNRDAAQSDLRRMPFACFRY